MWKLSASDWAAWVQAVGSIAAIIGAAAIAIWEAHRQYKGSIRAAEEARTHFLTGKLDGLYVEVLGASDDLSALFELAEIAYNVPAWVRLERELKRARYDLIYERYTFYLAAAARCAPPIALPCVLQWNVGRG